MNLAPIVLFVYNRPWHTQQTLEALAKNDLASESVLYIFADGPKENEAEETLEKINETRSIIRSQQWSKEVIIKEKEKNAGLADSIIDGVTEIVNKYGKIIVLEDDIVTSISFLEYMNAALNLYENEKKVSSISGYLEPINFKGKRAVFLTKGSSWGWATWKRTWEISEWDARKLLQILSTDKRINEFNYSDYPFYNMLQDQVEKKIDSWAIRFYASCFLNGGLHLTPPKSLVKNLGFDGSGTHCGADEKMIKTTVINTVPDISDIPIIANLKVPELVKIIRQEKRSLFKELKSNFKKRLKIL